MMSGNLQSTDNRVLSAPMFEHLSAVLCEIAQATGNSVILTETCLSSLTLSLKRHIHRFVVVVSPGFSALLLGEIVHVTSEFDDVELQGEAAVQESYDTGLEFEVDAIAEFLVELQQEFAPEQSLHQQLSHAIEQLQPNSVALQTQFILRFAEVMSHHPTSAFVSPLPSSIDETFTNQAQQDRVFNEVATQIRQTQELSLVLKTAIQQVRLFLQVDRVIIYQFETAFETLDEMATHQPQPTHMNLVCGRITYEDRANSAIPQILNLSEGVQCFIGVPDYRERYRKGAIQAVDDIRITYAEAPCLVNLLEWAHVQAKLVVPIVLQEELWGLLIVHQCSTPRHWLDGEIQFLRCVAELLAIAIYQNQLYSRLQLQAQTLEQRVVERTQELDDAMNAAQSASLAKTEFLATVSHELRTPLTAIIGMSTTLLRVYADARREKLLSLEKQQEYLTIIRNSGEHLLELINDIIDLSQVEAGRTILDVQEFPLFQVAHECVRMLRDKAQQNHIKLELDLQLKLPSAQFEQPRTEHPTIDSDRFTADPRRVKQILLNLLSNAIKFTPQGGQVTLRIWVEPEGAIIQVEDTGIGIPDDQFPLLFKKFQQLDQAYHRQYEGTGLGLALTKQLVELHGGRIDVDSTVDLGSTFTVRLPRQPLKACLLPNFNLPPTPSPPYQTARRIVLVENHEFTANLICDLLAVAGYQVIWMIDGMTALQQIAVIKPEAVLVGTQLTGMSFAEVLQRLRQNPATHAIKILLLLKPTDAQSDRGFVEAANAYLTLPINRPEELLDKIRGLITPQKQEEIEC